MAAGAESSDLDGVRAAYDVVAGDYARHLPDTRAETAIDLAMVDAFAAVVGSGADALVLDAGCGAGRMARFLADRGLHVAGIDLSAGMVAVARRDHPDLEFVVGTLTEIPYDDDTFAGLLLWYSIIHTPPADLGRVFSEVARVLQPGGHALVGFQAGVGIRDVSAAYRRFGHDVHLQRQLHLADDVAAALAAAGLIEVSRLVRRPEGGESEDQAVILAGAD